MDHETLAREKHRNGYSCSVSVYSVFSDINKQMTSAPVPRSEGGRCGAVLAAEKTMREIGIGNIEDFEEKFAEKFGSVHCSDIIRTGRRCNECVGFAAAYVDSL